jgi:hypothetical protein
MFVNKLWTIARWAVHFLDVTYHFVLPRVVLVAIVLTLVHSDIVQAHDREAQLDYLLSGKLYDFVSWEIDAAVVKISHEFVLPELGLTDSYRAAFVKSYLQRVGELQRLDGQINQIYSDPAVKDATAASADLRAQRDQLRAALQARQNLAEAIIQEQVSSVLREEGFAIGGQVMPPVRFRFTELPYVMIISRRDKIERIDQRELQPVTVDVADGLEREVDQRFGVSSLVTEIGGLGAYPTMLPETSSLEFTISTVAHEWTHNYLLFSPVGINYASDPVARIINETTAVIVEEEISTRVIQRYYPELIQPPAPAQTPAQPSTTKPGNQPPPFNFNEEMRITRAHVDELLAAGKIDEAESYMNDRRAVFVKNGYVIRKLNQAWFAFHGAYNATPGGAPAAGQDPIGPAVQDLRKRSDSVGDFVRKIATVRTLADVINAR